MKASINRELTAPEKSSFNDKFYTLKSYFYSEFLSFHLLTSGSHYASLCLMTFVNFQHFLLNKTVDKTDKCKGWSDQK